MLPAVTGSGESLWVTDRSATAWMVVLSEVVSLAVSGSLSLPVTLAVLLRFPLLVDPTATRIVTVALVLAARLPTAQLMIPPDWLQVPWLGAAERKLTPAGRVSLKATPVAGAGPLLVTVRV